MQLPLSLAFFFASCIGLTAIAQTPLNVFARIPADVQTIGLEEGDLQYLEHEIVVDIPAMNGEVRVMMGTAPGDTSFLNRPFPLAAQQWADGTWVASAASGAWQLGLGRYIGIDSFAIEVRDMSDALIGTGSWTKP